MLIFEPFDPGHIKYIKPQAVQTEEYEYLLAPGSFEALASGPALSAWASGTCVGAAGIVMAWRGRGEAWMLLGENARPYLRPIIRKIRCVLDTVPLRRVDMAVKASNACGHSLARALKFEYEATLEGFHMSGEDMVMYKRIKWL